LTDQGSHGTDPPVAQHASALKRHRQSEKRRVRNKGLKTQLRHIVRSVRASVEKKDRRTRRRRSPRRRRRCRRPRARASSIGTPPRGRSRACRAPFTRSRAEPLRLAPAPRDRQHRRSRTSRRPAATS
jgi:ribosomal protein S20